MWRIRRKKAGELFVLVPRHELLEVEHVVVRSGAYFVAEKDGLAV
jgi:hypothetical protein